MMLKTKNSSDDHNDVILQNGHTDLIVNSAEFPDGKNLVVNGSSIEIQKNLGAIPKDQFSSVKASTDQTSTENSSSVCHVDNVTEEISELSIHENQQQSDDSKEVEYIVYENELQMPCIMRLIQKDLSEPYSIYTYRYFIHNWPHLCFMVSTSFFNIKLIRSENIRLLLFLPAIEK